METTRVFRGYIGVQGLGLGDVQMLGAWGFVF